MKYLLSPKFIPSTKSNLYLMVNMFGIYLNSYRMSMDLGESQGNLRSSSFGNSFSRKFITNFLTN
eukprot:XP_762936.1 hypothetical protein [Theileria parva strain Muguga]